MKRLCSLNTAPYLFGGTLTWDFKMESEFQGEATRESSRSLNLNTRIESAWERQKLDNHFSFCAFCHSPPFLTCAWGESQSTPALPENTFDIRKTKATDKTKTNGTHTTLECSHLHPTSTIQNTIHPSIHPLGSYSNSPFKQVHTVSNHLFISKRTLKRVLKQNKYILLFLYGCLNS